MRYWVKLLEKDGLLEYPVQARQFGILFACAGASLSTTYPGHRPIKSAKKRYCAFTERSYEAKTALKKDPEEKK
ncbi:MAG: hypothetical protein SOX32_09935 [Candidatus Choladocola sp.]|nr:hypothetical protein [Candidatus Choladocola sp.]